jgi:hypothetical protein
MKTKYFFANVDEDAINFYSLSVDDNNQVILENKIDKDYCLSNNPTVLDITHLNYIPPKNSVWNGSEFIASKDQEFKSICGEDVCQEGCVVFAFLLDNVYYGSNSYCLNVANNNMIIAALSSNPTITYLVR